MPKFKNINDMNDYIGKIVEEVLTKVSDDVEEKVFNLVKNRIYTSSRNVAGYRSTDYDRTYDFLTSVTRAEPRYIDGKIEVEIFYDSNKLLPQQGGTFSYWNSHMDIHGEVDNIWDGKSIPELLPLWIEQGTNNGLAPRYGIHVMEDVYNELKTIYKKEFAKELKKYKIKTK